MNKSPLYYKSGGQPGAGSPIKLKKLFKKGKRVLKGLGLAELAWIAGENALEGAYSKGEKEAKEIIEQDRDEPGITKYLVGTRGSKY